MRPLWLTTQKQFKNRPTIWIVNGILHRRDVLPSFVEDVNEALRFMCDQLRVVYRDPNTEVTKRGYGKNGIHLKAIVGQQLMNFILTDLFLEAHRHPLKIIKKKTTT